MLFRLGAQKTNVSKSIKISLLQAWKAFAATGPKTHYVSLVFLSNLTGARRQPDVVKNYTTFVILDQGANVT